MALGILSLYLKLNGIILNVFSITEKAYHLKRSPMSIEREACVNAQSVGTLPELSRQ